MARQFNLFEYYGIKFGNEADEEENKEQPGSKDGKQPTSQPGSKQADKKEENKDDEADETEDEERQDEDDDDEEDADSGEDNKEQSSSQPTSGSKKQEEETEEPEHKSGELKGNFKEVTDKMETTSQAVSSASPTIVISAFVCSGKSTFAANCEYVKDLESSIYSKKPDGSRSDEFPGNYISAIKWQLNNNNWKYLLVSSHQDVRNALKEAGIKYYLFYPALERKEEIIKICQERGNDAEFIQLIQENYESWVAEMSKEENAYPLQEGEFLSLELFEKKYKFLYQ